MERRLIKLHYRDYYIYLILITLLCFSGIYLVPNFIADAGYFKNLNKLAMMIIILKSFCIFEIVRKLSNRPFFSFILAAMYSSSPIHLGTFLFNYQFQASVAEFLILVSGLLYLNKKQWVGFILLSLSILFYTPFIVFGVFLFLIKDIDKRIRHLYLIQALLTLIYSFPKLNGKELLYLNNFHNIPHHFGELFLPARIDFLNIAVLNPDYLNLSIGLYSALLLLCSVIIFNKKSHLYYWLIALLLTIISSFIPFMVMENNNNFIFFNSPALMPSLLFLIFYLVYGFFQRLNFSKTCYVLAIFISLIWATGNVFQQYRLQQPEKIWDEAVMSLPENINYEEEVKLKYARYLLSENKIDKAEAYIGLAAEKFQKEKWYLMLMAIASQKKDLRRIQELQKALDDKHVPFSEPSLRN